MFDEIFEDSIYIAMWDEEAGVNELEIRKENFHMTIRF